MDNRKGKPERRYQRISRQEVRRAIQEQIELAAAHLDLEGFAYIKVTRTGANECFAADVTQRVLTKEEPADGMTIAEVARTFWRTPAMQKWGR